LTGNGPNLRATGQPLATDLAVDQLDEIQRVAWDPGHDLAGQAHGPAWTWSPGTYTISA